MSLIDTKDKCPICSSKRASFVLNWDNYIIVQCLECDLVRSDPHATDLNIYEESYKERKNTYQNYFKYLKNLKNSIPITWAQKRFYKDVKSSHGLLLDIGCSTGAFLLNAKKNGWKVHGLEPSKNAATVVSEITKAPVYCGILEKGIYAKNYFDTVTAWEAIEHLANPLDFLKIVFEILKPSGQIAISTPNWDSPWEKSTRDLNRRPPFHLNFFTDKTLIKIFKMAGFK